MSSVERAVAKGHAGHVALFKNAVGQVDAVDAQPVKTDAAEDASREIQHGCLKAFQRILFKELAADGGVLLNGLSDGVFKGRAGNGPAGICGFALHKHPSRCMNYSINAQDWKEIQLKLTLIVYNSVNPYNGGSYGQKLFCC